MVGRQRLEGGAEIAQLVLRRADAEQATVLLHHVDAGAAVRRIDHQVHRTLRAEHVAKRAQADVRVGQVMEHAGAHDLVERAPQFPDALDRELMEFEIVEVVLALQIARVAQAGLADVDGRDSRLGLAQRMAGRLRRAAAGDQDLLVLPRLLGRPHPMEQRPAAGGIPIEVPSSSRLVSGAG